MYCIYICILRKQIYEREKNEREGGREGGGGTKIGVRMRLIVATKYDLER